MEGDGKWVPAALGALPRRDLKVSRAGSTRRDWDAAVSELPLSPLLSCQAHAGGSEQRSMWRSGERGERARAVQAATSTLLATKPGLRSCACQPASAASHGGSRRPPRCRGAVTTQSLPSLDGAGLAVSDPLASSSASPEVWARPAPPCGVPTCFGSALQPVPGGWPGPCSPSLPSVVARVKCVLRPV